MSIVKQLQDIENKQDYVISTFVARAENCARLARLTSYRATGEWEIYEKNARYYMARAEKFASMDTYTFAQFWYACQRTIKG